MNSTARTLIRLEGQHPLAEYCRVTSAYCPFIMPSKEARTLMVREVDLPGITDIDKLQSIVFAETVAETEALRQDRRGMPVKQAQLLNYNVVFHHPDPDIDGRELVDWPGYCAKLLYTGIGVMYGLFWKNQEEMLRNGRPMPVPPVNFVSVRSKVQRLDWQFFDTHNQHLKQPHVDATDSEGINVHRMVFSDAVPDDLSDVNTLVASGYYGRVRDWASEILARVENNQ
jgi:hypothetical protein